MQTVRKWGNDPILGGGVTVKRCKKERCVCCVVSHLVSKLHTSQSSLNLWPILFLFSPGHGSRSAKDQNRSRFFSYEISRHVNSLSDRISCVCSLS